MIFQKHPIFLQKQSFGFQGAKVRLDGCKKKLATSFFPPHLTPVNGNSRSSGGNKMFLILSLIFAANSYITLYMRILLALLMICSCSPAAKFRKDSQRFDASAVTHSFKSVADMNDSYFEIRENSFFEFYRQLFDSVKNTRYPGTFTLRGDTMMLKFYDKKGYRVLGNKALIRNGEKEIYFFK